ncbi:hypothetical protein BH23BAC4_BH23BAC4_13840 [soil metagenome]
MEPLLEPRPWIEIAQEYAQAGFTLVPAFPRDGAGLCLCGLGCEDRFDVHPLTPDWRGEATRVAAGIRAWADLWKDADVAAAIGAEYRLSCLVIDGVEGRESLREVMGAYRRLPRGPQFTDPLSTRAFFLFEHPLSETESTVELAPGLKVIMGDGMVRLPLTRGMENTRSGQWVTPPSAARPPRLPQWLQTRLGGKRNTSGALPSASFDGGLPFRPADALLRLEGLDADWVAFPWAKKGAITLLAGTPKVSGKTRLLLHLATAAASGAAFLGEWTAFNRVLYLSEQPLSSLRISIEEARLDDRERLKNIHLLSATDVAVDNWDLFIDDLGNLCDAQKVGLVIIDSLEAFAGRLGGKDFFASPEIATGLSRLANRGVSVIVSTTRFDQRLTLEAQLNRFGRMAATADTVMALRPGGTRNTLRVIESVSRDPEVPATTFVEWQRTSFAQVNAGEVLPLFRLPGAGGSPDQQTTLALL